MRNIRYYLASLMIPVLIPLAARASSLDDRPDVATILTRVRENISRIDSVLPNIVVSETIRSGRPATGKPQHERVTQAEFVCLRKMTLNGLTYKESHTVTAVNGKPVPKGTEVRGALVIDGGFMQSLRNTFAVRNEEYQVFSSPGTERLNGRETIVLEFATKTGQSGMGFNWYGHGYVTNDKGKAWIDPATMQVLRFERTYSGLPHQSSVTFQVDYSEMPVQGVAFFLPRVVTAFEERPGSGSGKSCITEYSNYRRFGSESSVRFDDKAGAAARDQENQ